MAPKPIDLVALVEGSEIKWKELVHHLGDPEAYPTPQSLLHLTTLYMDASRAAEARGDHEAALTARVLADVARGEYGRRLDMALSIAREPWEMAQRLIDLGHQLVEQAQHMVGHTDEWVDAVYANIGCHYSAVCHPHHNPLVVTPVRRRITGHACG